MLRWRLIFTAIILLPLIGIVHARWGFDTLFVILAVTAATIFTAVVFLPRQMPEAAVAPAE